MNLLMPGVYVPSETVIHRLDPRVKMGAATLLMVLPFAAPSALSSALLIALIAAISALARVPLRALLRALRSVLWLGLFMFTYYAFTVQGEPVASFLGISVTSAGLVAGARQIYRLCALIIVASLLTYSTSSSQLAHGIESLLRPLARVGFPVRELAMVLTIALRFVPTIADQVEKVSKSQRARGMDPGWNPLRRVQSWVPMFVPVFVLAYRRAENLAVALEARGFRGTEQRTRLHRLQLARRDLWAALAVASATLLIIAASRA